MSINQAAIALHRFGMGATPGQPREIAGDPRGYLLEQLRDPLPPLLYGPYPTSRDRVRALAEARSVDDAYRAETREIEFVEACRQSHGQEMEGRFWTAVQSRRSFAERLAWFWSNHFAISVSKPYVAPFGIAYEREAIRPYVLGRFEDMLLAVTRHPAMLTYLDNWNSVGADTEVGRFEQRGRNENLGREIMELHTLGVDGGYTQKDVEALSTILTGWNVPLNGNAEFDLHPFVFRPEAHEPGPVRLLGKLYGAGGLGQGEVALHDLAHHPSTARFVATKFARHFVADDPPPALVQRLTANFLETGGDLRALAWTLVNAPEAWAPERRKLRTPAEFIVALVKAWALKGGVDIYSTVTNLEHPPLAPTSPAGFPDRAQAWAGPDAILRRVTWCLHEARLCNLDMSPVELAFDVMGSDISDNTLDRLARAPRGRVGFGMVVAAPEFQWR